MCTSAWVSTPPVMACVSTMVNAISFLWLKGWHAPAGRRTCEPRPLPRPGRSGRQRRWVPQSLGPGRQTVSHDNTPASADPEARPGPRPPALRPRQVKAREAGPEALPALSLPIRSWWAAGWLVVARAARFTGSGCSPALPADRPYLASAMHSQRQPDSLDVIGGGHVASGVPRWAGAGRGEQNGGPADSARDSLHAPASVSAPGRWPSHCA
jgi:hypothetical protein